MVVYSSLLATKRAKRATTASRRWRTASKNNKIKSNEHAHRTQTTIRAGNSRILVSMYRTHTIKCAGLSPFELNWTGNMRPARSVRFLSMNCFDLIFMFAFVHTQLAAFIGQSQFSIIRFRYKLRFHSVFSRRAQFMQCEKCVIILAGERCACRVAVVVVVAKIVCACVLLPLDVFFFCILIYYYLLFEVSLTHAHTKFFTLYDGDTKCIAIL